MSQPKFNKSRYFVLPVLGVNINSFTHLVNVYIGDYTHPEYVDCLFVLYNKQEDRLKSIDNYKDSYEIDGKYMYVYEIPDKYLEDVKKFINGDYSQFSPEYKTKIVKHVPLSTNVKDIINPTPDGMKQLADKLGVKKLYKKEVYSIPDLTEEIYKYDK